MQLSSVRAILSWWANGGPLVAKPQDLAIPQALF